MNADIYTYTCVYTYIYMYMYKYISLPLSLSNPLGTCEPKTMSAYSQEVSLLLYRNPM